MGQASGCRRFGASELIVVLVVIIVIIVVVAGDRRADDGARALHRDFRGRADHRTRSSDHGPGEATAERRLCDEYENRRDRAHLTCPVTPAAKLINMAERPQRNGKPHPRSISLSERSRVP